jgi:hypothetical protein
VKELLKLKKKITIASLILISILFILSISILFSEISGNIRRTLTGLGIGIFQAQTRIYVDPKDTIDTNLKLGDNFTFDIKVEDVTNMIDWQFRLYYDPNILNCADVWLPESHVFAGKTLIIGGPNLDVNSILYGAVLFPLTQTPFSGSGKIATVKCKVKVVGSSVLNITNDDTFLQDSNNNKIESSLENGLFSNTQVNYGLPVSSNFYRNPPEPTEITILDEVAINVTWSDDGALNTVIIWENSTGWKGHVVYP